MAHFRRKLQIINYFMGGELVFDYNRCLKNSNLLEEKKDKLIKLYQAYESREKLQEKDVRDYENLAFWLTKRILKQ